MKIETRHIPALNKEISYIVGSNAHDNHDIIDTSEPTDIWFHLFDHSSCHIIAKIPTDIKLDKKQKLQIIKQGAIICKQNSKLKSQQKVEIVYTNIANVIKEETAGKVRLLESKLITI